MYAASTYTTLSFVSTPVSSGTNWVPIGTRQPRSRALRPGATRGRPGGRRADGSRREALLQAAVREFLQRGYEGTSLLHIIQQVGGSRRAIYEEFGDKRGLFTAAVQEVCRGGASAADQARVFELPPEQALRIFGQRLLNVLTSR